MTARSFFVICPRRPSFGAVDSVLAGPPPVGSATGVRAARRGDPDPATFSFVNGGHSSYAGDVCLA